MDNWEYKTKAPKTRTTRRPWGRKSSLLTWCITQWRYQLLSFLLFFFGFSLYTINLLNKTNCCNFQGGFIAFEIKNFIMRTKKAVKWIIFLHWMFICKQHDSLYIQNVDYFSWAVDRVEWFKLACTLWTSALTPVFFVFVQEVHTWDKNQLITVSEPTEGSKALPTRVIRELVEGQLVMVGYPRAISTWFRS